MPLLYSESVKLNWGEIHDHEWNIKQIQRKLSDWSLAHLTLILWSYHRKPMETVYRTFGVPQALHVLLNVTGTRSWALRWKTHRIVCIWLTCLQAVMTHDGCGRWKLSAAHSVPLKWEKCTATTTISPFTPVTFPCLNWFYEAYIKRTFISATLDLNPLGHPWSQCPILTVHLHKYLISQTALSWKHKSIKHLLWPRKPLWTHWNLKQTWS